MRLDARSRRAAALLAASALAVPGGAAASQDLRNPDTRDAAAAASVSQDLRSPDARDAAAGRGTFNSPDVEVVKVAGPVVDDGFSWGDAGIGAGAIFALGVVAVGGSLLVAHRRHGGGKGPAVAAG